MKTVVYFIRHAEPDYSVHDDASRSLTDKGIEAALSSPYRRAIDTIKPFVETNNMKVELVEDFRERKVDSCWTEDFHGFSQRQWEDFNFKLSDGESLNEVQERNIKALKKVLKKFYGKKIVIGTHGTALSTIINYYESAFGYAHTSGVGGMPCGACREFLMQLSFKNKDIEIMVDYKKRETIRLEELLPNWWGIKRYEENNAV
ncbi:2,3-bisphosphoglycerate-dependent phosphoglycerate mutase [Clostridium acidisoli DSM 12555]|uniref:2,3-bisphosphoglycerate-dependent phosphoglycerate mutase n=1 Tax=Clostridium acidisoli DSM 12555 TaxID=1121291 RepID=A0A1W1XEK3_9CLOT|nr:histidine phosphatase family protein [Clostridium acidisoli]SMC22214.1 2,3-bisphosphoglycerate-dependent phosphoglycerate mutase [Clostridium acidisoli DSM 12555]